MKRILAMILTLCIAVPLMPPLRVHAVTGTIGGFTWDYDTETHALVINGTGELPAFSSWSGDESAWYDYSAEIESVTLSEGITSLGAKALIGCLNLREIHFPESLTKIGAGAFEYCGFVELTIPATVKEVGGGAFEDCGDLERIVFAGADTQFSGRYMFRSCYSLTDVQLPANLKALGQNDFQDCESLTHIDLPDSITLIQRRCFMNCRNLVIDRLPENLETIEEYAFEQSAFADDLVLPPHLSYIAVRAFPRAWTESRKMVLTDAGFLYSYQTKFEGVSDYPETILPEHTRIIGDYAFTLGCDNLDSSYGGWFKTLRLYPNVVEISKNAFFRCYFSEISGYTGSFAQEYALGNGFTFIPLEEDTTNPVAPNFGTDTLSIGNSSAMLGTGYPMSEWHTAVFREAPGGTTFDLKSNTDGWAGSCYGLAALQILLQAGVFTPEQFGADSIAEIRPTDELISFINCLHQTSRLPFVIGLISDQVNATQPQVLARVIMQAQSVNNGDAPFMLFLRTAGNGMHAVAAYGLESGNWEWDGTYYTNRVLLWDSNYIAGGDRVQLYCNDKMQWCIPAYGIYYAGTNAQSGALLYCFDDLPAQYAYFTARYAPLPGDLTSDAQLSMADAVAMSRLVTEAAGAAPAKKTGWLNADATGDGVLDIADTAYILRAISAG